MVLQPKRGVSIVQAVGSCKKLKFVELKLVMAMVSCMSKEMPIFFYLRSYLTMIYERMEEGVTGGGCLLRKKENKPKIIIEKEDKGQEISWQ